MTSTTVATHRQLTGVPTVNFAENLRATAANGRRMSTILLEVVALRRAPGQLSPSGYFYYRLWDARLTLDQKRAFVGKQAQHRMHVACNDRHWYQAAADKILLHTIMVGAALPVPPVLAITQTGRTLRGGQRLGRPEDIAALLRDPAVYPLFAKEAAGKYSLNVISADTYDASTEIPIVPERRMIKRNDSCGSWSNDSNCIAALLYLMCRPTRFPVKRKRASFPLVLCEGILVRSFDEKARLNMRCHALQNLVGRVFRELAYNLIN